MRKLLTKEFSMKTLLVFLSFFTILSSFAAQVSPKALVGLESRIDLQRSELNQKLNSINTDDITEGKIVAAMVNMIESKLEQAENSLDSIESDNELTEERINKINQILDESERLIKEI